MAPRPTPEGRDWVTRDELVNRILDALIAYDSRVENVIDRKPELIAALAEALADLSFEFKILRLTERIFDNLRAGTYETVDQVREDFAQAYTQSVLDCFDENGNLLPECGG